MLLDWNIIDAIVASPAARLVLMYGPPGTGKTTAACNAGNPAEFYNVTLTDETAAAELRGHWMPGEVWQWMDGPCMRAFRGGHRLVLNEIDKASADALDFLHALLDDPGVSAFTLPTGETVRPGAGFNVRATMNGVPEDLPDAVRDRFAIRLEITEPHPDAIARFDKPIQDAIRGTVPSGDDDRRASLRAFSSYVDLEKVFGDETAAKAVFQHRADEVLTAVRLAGAR